MIDLEHKWIVVMFMILSVKYETILLSLLLLTCLMLLPLKISYFFFSSFSLILFLNERAENVFKKISFLNPDITAFNEGSL